MKIRNLLSIAFFAAVLPAIADQTVDIPKEKPVLTFKLPDSWEVKHDESGILSNPKDEDSVILEITDLEATDAEAALKEAKETIKEFKNVKYDEPQKGEKDGLVITIYNATGEDESGKAFINLVLLNKKDSKKIYLLTCISSKEGTEKHGSEISAAIQSLAAK